MQNSYIWVMEMKVQMPFQQLLKVVKNLPPSQKAKLRKELDEELPVVKEKINFIEMLLNGPVYSEADIKTIQENSRSISA